MLGRPQSSKHPCKGCGEELMYQSDSTTTVFCPDCRDKKKTVKHIKEKEHRGKVLFSGKVYNDIKHLLDSVSDVSTLPRFIFSDDYKFLVSLRIKNKHGPQTKEGMLSYKRACNICGSVVEMRNKFDRFCDVCKMKSDTYRFGDLDRY